MIRRYIAIYFIFLALPAVALAQDALLTWEDNSDIEDVFIMERRTGTGAFAEIAYLPADTETYTDRGLMAGVEHCWQVSAQNTAGRSAPSNIACMTFTGTQPPPATPTGLTVKKANGRFLQLRWNASPTATAYEITRDGVPLVTILSSSTEAQEYIDKSVKKKSRYCYTVAARNSIGTSPPSASVCGST